MTNQEIRALLENLSGKLHFALNQSLDAQLELGIPKYEIDRLRDEAIRLLDSIKQTIRQIKD